MSEPVTPPAPEPPHTKQWHDAPTAPKAPFALPPIVPLSEFLAIPIPMPEVVVEGYIRRQSVVMFASSSKSYKTWTLLQLALCVAEGLPWLDRKTTKGKVLYLNFELSEAELQHRLSHISSCMALGEESNLEVCNLRGHATDVAKIMPAVIRACANKTYSLIIPDPIYSMMGERNENAANEMADFLNHLSLLSEATSAAVVYTHHFAKGMASSKEQIDRASGSGVFARHADGIITLTRHQDDNAFVVEAELRSFPRPAPFTIKWDFPAMEVVDLDPTKLKVKAGRPAAHSVNDIVSCLPTDGLSSTDWKAEASKSKGIQKTAFFELKRLAIDEEMVVEKDGKWVKNPRIIVLNPISGTTTIRSA